MTGFWQDIRYGFRRLTGHAGFTIVSVLTLALAIGATTAIFSVADAVLLHPLPLKEPGRLVHINEFSAAKQRQVRVSMPLFLDLQNQKDVFADVVAFTYAALLFPGEEFSETVYGFEVSPDFFTFFGVQPVAGRVFTADGGHPDNGDVLVISHQSWQKRFGGDPSLVGKTILMSDRPYTIIGIMPPEFQFPRRGDLGEFWQLHVPSAEDSSHPTARLFRNWGVAARLADNVSRHQAQTMADTVAWRIAQEFPDQCEGWRIQIQPLRGAFSDEKLQQSLLGLLGAIAFVLLIACANIASLLLAQAEVRSKELTMRAALGAGRLRLVRQLLIESVLMALLGGALGLLVTSWGIDVLAARIPDTIPLARQIGVDARVLGVTFLLSVLTGVGFSILPAWRASRLCLNETLKEGGCSLHATSGHRRLSHLLVVSEVALAIVLLAGAGLMVQSVARLLHADPGFDPHSLLRIGVSFPFPRYKEFAQCEPLIDQLVERFGALPGAQSIGICEPGGQWAHVIEGQAQPVELVGRGCSAAGTDYFRAMRIPLLKGRFFTQEDIGAGQRSIVINETMARLCWPGEDPLGKRVRHEQSQPDVDAWYTVVGVVGDAKDWRLDAEVNPEYYQPYQRTRPTYIQFMVRAGPRLDLLTANRTVRHEIKTIDPYLPAPKVWNVEKEFFDSTAPRRTYLMLMGLFAAMGLFLALIGIYGVVSTFVNQRTHEIGIRMALGARRGNILRLAMRNVLLLICAGSVVGLAGAVVLTRGITSLLYGISPSDPITLAGACVLLMATGLVACYIPARRATKVDPVVALRCE